MDAVLLDTCVLLKSYPCDTLLSIAEEGVYRPLWSEHVLAELQRNLIKAGAKQEAVEHRLAQMAAYFPDARVTSYEELTGSMTNHPKDRHVLAAAVAGRADVLVTENLKDFPPAAVARLGITVAGQDDFLSGRAGRRSWLVERSCMSHMAGTPTSVASSRTRPVGRYWRGER
jgi:predicted nucleic acid-binding protein